MKKIGVLVLMLTMALVVYAIPAGAFIGTGINIDKQFGNSIDFNLDKNVQAAGAAYGLADMDLGVNWGADVNLNTLAGYPYGYGGIGAITDGNVGYNLGLSMNEAHGAGFDGSSWGIPATEGTATATKYDNSIADNQQISDAVVALPFTGFPVL